MAELCIGLDNPDTADSVFEKTVGFAAWYKLNLAGWIHDLPRLYRIVDRIRSTGEARIICDGKFGDVPHMSERYAEFAFSWADAVTANPWRGKSTSAEPFIKRGLTFLPTGLDWSIGGTGLIHSAIEPGLAITCQSDKPVLIPGIGAQGGVLEEVLKVTKPTDIVSMSRYVEGASYDEIEQSIHNLFKSE